MLLCVFVLLWQVLTHCTPTLPFIVYHVWIKERLKREGRVRGGGGGCISVCVSCSDMHEQGNVNSLHKTDTLLLEIVQGKVVIDKV